MSWSILLLPLLGGYYYLTRCIRTKFRYKRLERQRLIFDSSIYGFGFLFISFALWLFTTWGCPTIEFWLSKIPLKIDFFYPSLLSFLLAYGWTSGFNFFKRVVTPNVENLYLAKAIEKTGNSMQLDLLKSYASQQLLMITLRNGKVYVGIATELNEPDGQSYIRILPFYSGYRTEKQDVKLVTDYLSVYDNAGGEDSMENINTETVICEEDIITTTFYDQEVFNRFSDSGDSS